MKTNSLTKVSVKEMIGNPQTPEAVLREVTIAEKNLQKMKDVAKAYADSLQDLKKRAVKQLTGLSEGTVIMRKNSDKQASWRRYNIYEIVKISEIVLTVGRHDGKLHAMFVISCKRFTTHKREFTFSYLTEKFTIVEPSNGTSTNRFCDILHEISPNTEQSEKVKIIAKKYFNQEI